MLRLSLALVVSCRKTTPVPKPVPLEILGRAGRNRDPGLHLRSWGVALGRSSYSGSWTCAVAYFFLDVPCRFLDTSSRVSEVVALELHCTRSRLGYQGPTVLTNPGILLVIPSTIPSNSVHPFFNPNARSVSEGLDGGVITYWSIAAFHMDTVCAHSRAPRA